MPGQPWQIWSGTAKTFGEGMNINQLNLNLLRALYALLTCANVTHAARQLNLTQSAMSRNLSLLRAHIGDPLLLREGTHYLLTDRAKQLLPGLQKIMEDIETLFSNAPFDPAQCKRSFAIASSDYVARYIFPGIVDTILEAAPDIRLNYKMYEPRMTELLGTLPIDLAVTMVEKPHKNLHKKRLGSDYPVCVMAENHPLASKDLTLKGLITYPHLRVTGGGDKDSFLDDYLAGQNTKRNISVTVPFFSSAFSILVQTRMLLTIPLHIAVKAKQYFPITYKEFFMEVPEQQYYILWHGIHHNDPAHRWLREQLFLKLVSATNFKD